MNIITSNPIEVQSSADATKTPPDSTKTPGKFKSFLKKEKGKIAAGHAARVEKRAARRAKRNARPLTKTGQWFHDHLPHVKKKSDGIFSKTLPDGTEQNVPASNVNQLPSLIGQDPLLVDTTDANGKKLTTLNVNGVPTAVTQYAANETVQATAPDGTIATYKASDTEDANTPPESEPMSTTTKILIVGGIVLVIAGVLILKDLKNKK